MFCDHKKVRENAKNIKDKKNHEKYIYAFGSLADRQRDKRFMEQMLINWRHFHKKESDPSLNSSRENHVPEEFFAHCQLSILLIHRNEKKFY